VAQQRNSRAAGALHSTGQQADDCSAGASQWQWGALEGLRRSGGTACASTRAEDGAGPAVERAWASCRQAAAWAAAAAHNFHSSCSGTHGQQGRGGSALACTCAHGRFGGAGEARARATCCSPTAAVSTIGFRSSSSTPRGQGGSWGSAPADRRSCARAGAGPHHHIPAAAAAAGGATCPQSSSSSPQGQQGSRGRARTRAPCPTKPTTRACACGSADPHSPATAAAARGTICPRSSSSSPHG